MLAGRRVWRKIFRVRVRPAARARARSACIVLAPQHKLHIVAARPAVAPVPQDHPAPFHPRASLLPIDAPVTAMARGRRTRGRAAAPPPEEEQEGGDGGGNDAGPGEEQQEDTTANKADESMEADNQDEAAAEAAETPAPSRRAPAAASATTQTGAPAEDESVLRILLSTDNHLGYLERDAIRGGDSFAAFEEVLSVARHHKADMVLLAGDLFHDNKPSRKTLHTVRFVVWRGVLVVIAIMGFVLLYFGRISPNPCNPLPSSLHYLPLNHPMTKMVHIICPSPPILQCRGIIIGNIRPWRSSAATAWGPTRSDSRSCRTRRSASGARSAGGPITRTSSTR